MLPAAYGAVDSPSRKCPIRFDRINLRYNHAGGQSVPQLNLDFTNRTANPIANIVLRLSILDTDGNPRPYPDDLTYSKEPIPGKEHKTYTWDLNTSSVDMHHTGESVTLQSLQYADGTDWKDDGSLSCSISVDFHAK
jgi:hypothetical protein